MGSRRFNPAAPEGRPTGWLCVRWKTISGNHSSARGEGSSLPSGHWIRTWSGSCVRRRLPVFVPQESSVDFQGSLSPMTAVQWLRSPLSVMSTSPCFEISKSLAYYASDKMTSRQGRCQERSRSSCRKHYPQHLATASENPRKVFLDHPGLKKKLQSFW